MVDNFGTWVRGAAEGGRWSGGVGGGSKVVVPTDVRVCLNAGFSSFLIFVSRRSQNVSPQTASRSSNCRP